MNRAAFFQRILVPVDGSDSSRKAARYAIRLAGREACAMEVVHVVDEDSAADLARYADRPIEEILERMRLSGEGYVEEIRALGRKEGVPLLGEVCVGVPHRVILFLAADRGADLIVMGKVGRRGPRRVLLGSVTERVIEHSPVPVLVVK